MRAQCTHHESNVSLAFDMLTCNYYFLHIILVSKKYSKIPLLTLSTPFEHILHLTTLTKITSPPLSQITHTFILNNHKQIKFRTNRTYNVVFVILNRSTVFPNNRLRNKETILMSSRPLIYLTLLYFLFINVKVFYYLSKSDLTSTNSTSYSIASFRNLVNKIR